MGNEDGVGVSDVGLISRSVNVGGRSYVYQVYVPERLAGQRDVPVILFLHGIRERGEGGFVPASGVKGVIARQFLMRLPAVVVLPQCASGKYWNAPEMEQMVMAELEQVSKEFSADAGRLYLVGVSMGGYGAWHIAAAHPGMFAAVVPICGGSPLTAGERFTPIAEKIGSTPVWAFHGSEDRVVPVSESRKMIEALSEVEGSRVRYSELEGVGHDVWFNAASDPELLPWLLSQRKG